MKSTKKIVYKGKIFTITNTKVMDSNGIIHTIEQCSRPDVVTVIGITSKKEIVMIKEFRPGIKRYVFWFPGGRVAKGEDPKDAGIREFEEETSFRPTELTLFHKKYPSDSFISNGYVYLAKGLVRGSGLIGDEKGKIETVFVPIKQAVKMALDGSIPNELFCFLIVKLSKSKELKILEELG